MDPTFTTLGAAIGGGLLVGLVARPVSWRLCAGVLILGLTFFILELWFASARVTSVDQLLSIVSLSALPPYQRFYGAIAIAYAAFLAAVIIGARVVMSPKKKVTNEP